MPSNKWEEYGISHSISLSGPIYIVQHTEIKMSKHPTSRPKDGAILDELMLHNCDRAAWNSNTSINVINKMMGFHFLFLLFLWFYFYWNGGRFKGRRGKVIHYDSFYVFPIISFWLSANYTPKVWRSLDFTSWSFRIWILPPQSYI